MSFDLIISNPPYISHEQLPHCNRGIFHEPAVALFAHPPLKFYAEIVARAANGWLTAGGRLVFECSPFNVHELEAMLGERFDQIDIELDSGQLPRVISAQRAR